VARPPPVITVPSTLDGLADGNFTETDGTTPAVHLIGPCTHRKSRTPDTTSPKKIPKRSAKLSSTWLIGHSGPRPRDYEERFRAPTTHRGTHAVDAVSPAEQGFRVRGVRRFRVGLGPPADYRGLVADRPRAQRRECDIDALDGVRTLGREDEVSSAGSGNLLSYAGESA
jgi:hypothetical protein